MFCMRGEGSFGSYVCTSSRVESDEGGHTRTLAGSSQGAGGRSSYLGSMACSRWRLYIMERLNCLD